LAVGAERKIEVMALIASSSVAIAAAIMVEVLELKLYLISPPSC